MLSCKTGVANVLLLGHSSSLSSAVNAANFIANAVPSDKCVLLHCQDMEVGRIIADLLPGVGLVQAKEDNALEDWYRAAIVMDINDY